MKLLDRFVEGKKCQLVKRWRWI